MKSKKLTLFIILLLGTIVLGGLFFWNHKSEKVGRIDFDYIKGGSVLYEVFITEKGERYFLSWKGHTKTTDNLRSISTDLSYLPPFGNLNVRIKGYKSFLRVNLSKYGRLSNFIMTDYQILNTVEKLTSKNTYICLDNNYLKAFYILNQEEKRSGTTEPTSFDLEFSGDEKVRLTNMVNSIVRKNEECWNTPSACDQDSRVCNLAKEDSRYERCLSLYIDCKSGSSAIRFNATGKGYFIQNSIQPYFRVVSYDISNVGGIYSDLIKSFKEQL